MEAFGAAGAGVGLLGSAVSGLKELRDFIGALHDGPYNLEMARRRLDQHAAFLPKLQAEYDTRYNGHISAEERAGFVRCLQDCQEDVKRYKEVLEKASKTRTRGKGLQKLEAGARMYFGEDDFKKQKSTFLDRTVQLQAFIDRAHRSFTGESLRGIKSSMTQHHAENINMHSSTQSSLQDKFNLVATQLATKEEITSGIDSIENQWKAVAKSIENSQQQAMSMHSSMDVSTTTIVRTMEENHREMQMVQHSHQATLQGMREDMSQFLSIAQFLTARSGHGIAPLGRRSSRQRIQERAHEADDSAWIAQIPLGFWQPGAVKIHKTPFGRLYVFVKTDSDRHRQERTRTSYFIRFLPFKIFSRTVVDWKCVINTSRSGPFMSMWCNVGRVCDDLDVIDALGLTIRDSCDICSRGWRIPDERICHHTKSPNANKLRRLLDQRRFTPNDLVEVEKGVTIGILKLFIQHHKPCTTITEYSRLPFGRCLATMDLMERNGFRKRVKPSRENPLDWKDLRTSYLEYYHALAVLVREAGCQLDRKDWFGSVSRSITVNHRALIRARLMTEVVAHRCHIMDVHTEFARTDQFMSNSVPRLLQSLIGDHIPLDHDDLRWYRPWDRHILYVTGAPVPIGCRSYLGHLLPYRSCLPEIMEVIKSIGGLEELASNLWFDRSILVMMSYSRPWLEHAMSFLTQGNGKLGPAFSFNTVLREMRKRHDRPELRALIGYITTYGHSDAVRRLVLEGFDAAMIIHSAAGRADDQILDYLLEKDTKWSTTKALKLALHVNHISDRICKDTTFREKLIDVLAYSFSGDRYDEVALAGFEYSPLAELLASAMTHISSEDEPDETPMYVSLLIDGCISRYESRNLSFPGDLWSFVYIVSRDFLSPMLPGTYQEFRWKGRILQRLLSTECFGSGIEYVPKVSPLYVSRPSRGEMRFTPLIMALESGLLSIVKLLLDAGAQITSRSSYGISAFRLAERHAQGDHPRVIYQYRRAKCCKFTVSKDIDEAMLQLLRETLRNRGEEVPCDTLQGHGEEVLVSEIPDIGIERPLRPFHRAYRKVQEWIKISLSWLLKPTANITQESLSNRFEYIAVVWLVGLLSVTRLLQPNAKWIATVGLRQFSRPVFLVPIMAWVIMTIWRYYVTEL